MAIDVANGTIMKTVWHAVAVRKNSHVLFQADGQTDNGRWQTTGDLIRPGKNGRRRKTPECLVMHLDHPIEGAVHLM